MKANRRRGLTARGPRELSSRLQLFVRCDVECARTEDGQGLGVVPWVLNWARRWTGLSPTALLAWSCSRPNLPPLTPTPDRNADLLPIPAATRYADFHSTTCLFSFAILAHLRSLSFFAFINALVFASFACVLSRLTPRPSASLSLVQCRLSQIASALWLAGDWERK